MLSYRLFAAPLAALAFTSMPAAAQMTNPPAGIPAAAMQQAQPYLAAAGESDVFEITTSQIAMMRSSNPDVRSFAQQMIADHTRTTNLALAAAREAGVTPPPPALDQRHRSQIDALLNAPAAQFDQVYLGQQVPAHEAALQLQRSYAQSGDEAPLRATAAAAVPIIERHLEHARTLSAKM